MAITLVLLLSTTMFVSFKGSRILSTLFAIDLGAGPLQLGVLFALNGLFPLLLVVYAGRIADRLDNRVMMYCGIAGFAACLLLPFLVPTLAMLYVAVALSGLASMLFVVATQNLVGVLSSTGTRTRNFSYYSLGESTANIIGPVFVGFAIDGFRHPLTYLCLAAYTAAWAVVLYLRHDTIPHATGAQQSEAPRAMQDLLKLPALRNALLTNGLVMAGIDLFNIYMPVYARSIGISASVIGVIIGAFGAAGFITRLAVPVVTRHWGERKMLAVALAIAAMAFVAFPLITSALLLAAAAFAVGLGLGCGQPLSMILAFNASPPGRSAEAIAMRLSVSYGTHVFVPPLLGAIGSAFGLAPIFWTCAVLLASGSLLSRRSG